jgi:hypothetical protein
MKRAIDGIICFQHMRDAYDAAIALENAGFEIEIQHDEAIDPYSDAAFMSVWRYVDIDADAFEAPPKGYGSPVAIAAVDAFWKEVQAIVDPFNGDLDNAGFGEPGSAMRGDIEQAAEMDAKWVAKFGSPKVLP